MKLRNIILSSTIILSSLAAGAQNEQEKTELTFVPHWYIQGQFGAQETLGETSFGRLISPNAQIGVGYRFNPYIGLRLAVNAWQSKGAFELEGSSNTYKWNYVAPTIDVMADLTNIIGGYKERCISAGIFAGVGANIGFSNDEALDVKNKLMAHQPAIDGLPLYWDGTKVKFMGKFGIYADYNINSRLSAGIELNANMLHDAYNSKQAHNLDWYFNGLVGVKYALGKTSEKKTVVVPAIAPTTVHDTVYVDRVVEKEVPCTNKAEKRYAIRRDVFFTISKTKISDKEMQKIEDVADFLKKNPESNVFITGYADKGTGSMSLNLRLSKQRANAVANILTDKYGIASERLIVESMDKHAEQPFTEAAKNRVAICIVE